MTSPSPASIANGYVVWVLIHGPDRVLVNECGEAVSANRARRRGVRPDVILIRADGWSLGTPHCWEHVARMLWEEQWCARIDLTTGETTFPGRAAGEAF